jgi:hypothetical protein
MPKFFFHVVRNGQRVEDQEGIDLPDLADANEEATQAAREIVSESILTSGAADRGEFHVTDAVGKELLVVPFPSVKAGQ